MKKSSGGVKRAKLGGKKTTKGQDASPKAKKTVMRLGGVGKTMGKRDKC